MLARSVPRAVAREDVSTVEGMGGLGVVRRSAMEILCGVGRGSGGVSWGGGNVLGLASGRAVMVVSAGRRLMRVEGFMTEWSVRRALMEQIGGLHT